MRNFLRAICEKFSNSSLMLRRFGRLRACARTAGIRVGLRDFAENEWFRRILRESADTHKPHRFADLGAQN